MDNHDNKEKRRPTRVELYDQPNKRPEKKTHFFFDKKADRTAKKEAAPTFKLDKQAKRSSQSNTDLNIKAQPTTNGTQPISNDTRSSRSQERLGARNGQATAAKITGLGSKSGKNKQPKNKKTSHRPFKIALGILLAVLVVMVIVFAIKQQDPVTDNSSDTTVSTSSKKKSSSSKKSSSHKKKHSSSSSSYEANYDTNDQDSYYVPNTTTNSSSAPTASSSSQTTANNNNQTAGNGNSSYQGGGNYGNSGNSGSSNGSSTTANSNTQSAPVPGDGGGPKQSDAAQ